MDPGMLDGGRGGGGLREGRDQGDLRTIYPDIYR